MGVAAVAVTAGHDRDSSCTLLFAVFFNDPGDKRVEIDHQPGATPAGSPASRSAPDDPLADFGLFIGFGYSVRGRERQAVIVFNEAIDYYARLQQQGEIESFESVFLEPHGGELSGFTLVRGDRDKLTSVRTSDEFARLTIRAGLIVEQFGVVATSASGSAP